jgi:signal transduction histidine kinase
VAEALTHAAEHSGSDQADVHLDRTRSGLGARIRDEGRGGAAESAGTGPLGMRRQVAALYGSTRVTSPAGGPTVVEVDLPCVW